MDKKDYNRLILKHIEKSFDVVMFIGALIACLASLILYFGSVPIRFAIINMMVGLSALIIFIFRKQSSIEMKVMFTIMVPIILGVDTFTAVGFYSGTTTLILISNAIAVLFLSRKGSIFIAALSMLVMSGLWIWSIVTGFQLNMEMTPVIWITQMLTMLLFIGIFHVSVNALRHYLLENIEELETAVERTYHLAYFDQLTGAYNQNMFMTLMNALAEKSTLKGYMVVFSLKSLNMINAIYGKNIGDEVLVEVVQCFKKILVKNETFARVGGNEFTLWMEHEDRDTFVQRIEEIEIDLLKIFSMSDMRKKIEYFIGFAPLDSSEISVMDAYDHMMMALTYAKYSQGDNIIGYDETFQEHLHRLSTLREILRDAVVEGSFDLNYQAKVDALTGKVIGVEALARWQTKDFGFISPVEFIPLIEQMRLSNEFGRVIVKKAFSDYKKLCEKYGEGLSLSVNIAPSFLMHERFAEFLKVMIAESQVPTNKLILEITESTVIEDVKSVNEVLKPLRDIGVRISLDDFGSGYSSLNYLSSLLVDELKIDKSLVDQILNNERSKILLATIIQLSKQYELSLVAEGVEEERQKDMLVEMGCSMIQGYLYSKPEAL